MTTVAGGSKGYRSPVIFARVQAMTYNHFSGLIAAVPTPMKSDGSLNLKPIQALAEYFTNEGVSGVYIAGTAGECYSLTLEERQRLSAWWAEVIRGTSLKLVVHVGHHCLADAKDLATHANKVGAYAVAAGSPSYFKPPNVERLVSCCQAVAAGAPNLPFYFDHLPHWTGVEMSAHEFINLARKRVVNLAGLIYGGPDLRKFQNSLSVADRDFEVIFGCEDLLIAGLAMGAQSALSSAVAFAAPIFKRLTDAFEEGDMELARKEQDRVCELLQTLHRYGNLVAGKAMMSMIGIDCGPPRLPLAGLSPSQVNSLRNALDRMEFFDWISQFHMHARWPRSTSEAA